MKRALQIQNEYSQIGTIQDLTSVFESISSMHIAAIREKVISSTVFFNQLWNIYTQLRAENSRVRSRKPAITDRAALVAITSEGGLIGDIDERIVGAVMTDPHWSSADTYVMGAHGAQLFAQRGVRPAAVYHLPESDEEIHVSTIVGQLSQYERVVLYYQTYVSLARQDIASLDLFSAVEALSQHGQRTDAEAISSSDYIFEPSLLEIMAYMESVMQGIALGQAILESKLAQYASRFNTMSVAKERAKQQRRDLRHSLSRARRWESDERTKELLSSLKIGRQHGN